MALRNKNKMPIPKEELAFVSQESRIRLFNHMLDTFKNCVPDLKLMVAYLHWNYNHNDKIKVVTNGVKNDIPGPTIIFKKKEDVNNPEYNKEYTLKDTSSYARIGRNSKEIEIPVYDQPCVYDYLLIFNYKVDDKSIIFIECPYISTRNSIPGYRYAIRTNQLELWLTCVINDMLRIPRPRFYDFITNMCGLSLDKTNEYYWKKEENFKFLMPRLLDLRLLYSNQNTY